MRVYLSLLTALLISVVFLGCKTQAPADKAPEDPVADPVPETLVITQELYDNTLAEVKIFVDRLNTVIRTKNFNAWKEALSEELFAQISSPEFLADISNENALKSRKIVLRTANDYFLNVVVPSRSNSVVDEIEFTSAHQVKVYHLDKTRDEPRRLRLYVLLKKDGDTDTWKIVE